MPRRGTAQHNTVRARDLGASSAGPGAAQGARADSFGYYQVAGQLSKGDEAAAAAAADSDSLLELTQRLFQGVLDDDADVVREVIKREPRLMMRVNEAGPSKRVLVSAAPALNAIG